MSDSAHRFWAVGAGGARRWLRLPGLSLQPAEIAKFTWVVYLAYSLAKKREKVATFSIGFLPHLLLAGLLVALCMAEPDFVWTPAPGSAGMTLSYELRPGGTRPGPKDAWDRFDRVVARLGLAMEGDSASAVAGALSDLAGAMNDVADAIESRPSRASAAEPERPGNEE